MFWSSESGPCNDIPRQGSVSHYQVFVVGFLTTVVCLLGVFGNACSAIVLAGPKMKTSLNCLLLGLTLFDTVLIVNTILIFCIPVILGSLGMGMEYAAISEYAVPVLYATGMTAQTGSVYSVIAVTVERYIAVCLPLYARSLCTWSRAKLYTLVVFLFSTVYNLPRWGEFVTVSRENSTVPVRNEMTVLRCDNLYITLYVQWANFVFMILLPLVILVVFNSIIFRAVHQSNTRRQELTRVESREINLAIMLLIVVAVFIFCNILPFVNNFMESMDMPLSQDLVDLSNFLVVFNSSINCFIYCVFGAKFRKHFFALLRSMFPCFSCICAKESQGEPFPRSTSHNTIRINYQSSRNYHASSARSLPQQKVATPKDITTNTELSSRNGVATEQV